MPQLDPQMADILALIEEAMKDRPERVSLAPVEARAQMNATFEAFWNADQPTLWAVYNHEIAGPKRAIRVRLYDPGLGRPAPCLIYLHGGGWAIGSLDTHDGVCRRLALAGDFLVASVDYRLAPEHKFPAGLEDCVAAVRWIAAHGAEWGIDTRRLAIGGDSAGANLSLATLLSLRDAGTSPMRSGVLIYGAYAADADTPLRCLRRWQLHHLQRGHALVLGPLHERRGGQAQSARGATARRHPGSAAAPGHRLRVRSAARRQRASGRPAEGAGAAHRYALWPGVTHGCIHMTRMLDVAQNHIEDIAAWVREQLSA